MYLGGDGSHKKAKRLVEKDDETSARVKQAYSASVKELL